MRNHTFIVVMLASSLACAVTTVGIYVISKYEAWERGNTVYFMSFAAGVLVSVSFIRIIPRSFQMHDQSPAFLLAGFLMLYLFNRFLNLYICHEYRCETATVGIIDRIARPTLGILLAVSAGALVYVGASHLLPEVEKENRRYSVISLAVGVLVAVAIVMSKQ
jgi:zinc transporter ZupT